MIGFCLGKLQRLKDESKDKEEAVDTIKGTVFGLRCVALRCVALRCVALRCVVLRCIVLC